VQFQGADSVEKRFKRFMAGLSKATKVRSMIKKEK
jgi:hypothetical protein